MKITEVDARCEKFWQIISIADEKMFKNNTKSQTLETKNRSQVFFDLGFEL